MAHPYSSVRENKVASDRADEMTKDCYAKGGAVKHSDAAEDRKLIKSMVKTADLKTSAKKAKVRGDRRMKRADGGRTNAKNAKTNINIIVSPQQPKPMMPPVPPMASGPPVPPPMPAGPPPGAGAGPPGAPPPGMMGPKPQALMSGMPGMPTMNQLPMRKRGGRVKRDDGGQVNGPESTSDPSADTSPMAVESQGRSIPMSQKSAQQGNAMAASMGMREPQNILNTAGKKSGGSVKRASGGRLISFYAFGGKVKRDDGGAVNGQNQSSLDQALLTQEESQATANAASKNRGGAVKRARGGKVESQKGVIDQGPGGSDAKPGAGWKEGLKDGTQVQGSPGKDDLNEIKSKPAALVRARGGKVGAEHKFPKMTGGGRGGLGRLEKAKAYGL